MTIKITKEQKETMEKHSPYKKDYFLGTKYSQPRKAHECAGCGCVIDPKDNDKNITKIRHDTWKENGKVVNKYFCPTCNALYHTQKSLQYTRVDGKGYIKRPYNPRTVGVLKRLYPHMYACTFRNKYENPFKRAELLKNIQKIYKDGFFAKIVYFIFGRILNRYDVGNYVYNFDKQDFKKFKEIDKEYNSIASYHGNL